MNLCSHLPRGLHKLSVGVPIQSRTSQLSKVKGEWRKRAWGEDLALGSLLVIKSPPGHSTEESVAPWEEVASV